jgi:hypothetical protein
MDNGPAVLENHFLLVITISAWQALLKHASVLKCNPADDPVQSLYIDRAGPARPVRPGRRICSVNPENPGCWPRFFEKIMILGQGIMWKTGKLPQLWPGRYVVRVQNAAILRRPGGQIWETQTSNPDPPHSDSSPRSPHTMSSRKLSTRLQLLSSTSFVTGLVTAVVTAGPDSQ